MDQTAGALRLTPQSLFLCTTVVTLESAQAAYPRAPAPILLFILRDGRSIETQEGWTRQRVQAESRLLDALSQPRIGGA